MDYILINPINNTNYLLKDMKNSFLYKTIIEFINVKSDPLIYGNFIFAAYDSLQTYFYNQEIENINIQLTNCILYLNKYPQQLTHKVILYSKEPIDYQFKNFSGADIFSLKIEQIDIEKHIHPVDALMRILKYLDENESEFKELLYDKYDIERLLGDYLTDPELQLTNEIKQKANFYIAKSKNTFIDNSIILNNSTYLQLFTAIDKINTIYDLPGKFPKK